VNAQGMSSAVRGAHRPEGILEKREDFLHAVAQLQACQLKLAGKMRIFLRVAVSKYTPR